MTEKKHSILAFVQPGNNGKKVLEEALRFQQMLDIRVKVLNVIKPLTVLDKNIKGQSENTLVSEGQEKLVSFVKDTLGDAYSSLFEVSVQVGKVDSVVINKANSGKFEFILLDKAICNVSDIDCKRKIDNIISESECPVLTIGKGSGISSIKNIAIPIDISQSTKKRLIWAQFFAKMFNAKVTILSALNSNVNIKNSLAYKNANRIKHILWEQNIDCEVRILPVNGLKKEDIILNYIENERPDLMIIRTHQQHVTAFSSIGKFVSQIIHGSKIPVLSVNYTPNPVKSLFL